MKTTPLAVKRSLAALFEMMILAALCFSSTTPRFLWPARQEDGIADKVAVRSVSRNSVAAPGPRSRAAGELKPKSLDRKKAKSMDRKTAQTTLSPTGRKRHASSNRAAVVAPQKTTTPR